MLGTSDSTRGQGCPGAEISRIKLAPVRNFVAMLCAAASTGSIVSRIPGVSNQSATSPSSSTRAATASRVVPAKSIAIATVRPATAFKSDDFPTFAAPTATIRGG